MSTLTIDEQIDECEKMMRCTSNKGELMRLRTALFKLKVEKIRMESGHPKYKAQSIR